MQLFGLGIAGLSYRFIVEPPEMVSCGRVFDIHTTNTTRFGLPPWQTLLYLRLYTVEPIHSPMVGEFHAIASSFLSSWEVSAGTGSPDLYLPDYLHSPSSAGLPLVSLAVSNHVLC